MLIKGSLRRRWTLLLLLGAPAAISLAYLLPEHHTAIFLASVTAIVPLAAFIGQATDDLAGRIGSGIAGLLNATFGNAAELIIGAIALFVAPVLVFLSYAIAPTPMDLLFTVFEVVAVGISVLTIAMIAHDGETHWMEGVQLLAVYAILVLAFYFLPARG